MTQQSEKELTTAKVLDLLLFEISQVFDGWHSDGTAWSEYDESIRKRVTEYRVKLSPFRNMNTPPSPEPAMSAEDENGLLSCPFCGSKGQIDYNKDGFNIHCSDEWCHGYDGELCFNSAKEAVESWNKRPSQHSDSLRVDWDELREKFIAELTGNYTGVQYMEVGDPDKIFNFFKTNIGGGK
jgi:hypothetical protein